MSAEPVALSTTLVAPVYYLLPFSRLVATTRRPVSRARSRMDTLSSMSLTKIGTGTQTLSGNQHLHGRDHGQWRRPDRKWLDRHIERRDGECGCDGRRHRHAAFDHDQRRRHARARQHSRQFDRHASRSAATWCSCRAALIGWTCRRSAADRTNVTGSASLAGIAHKPTSHPGVGHY